MKTDHLAWRRCSDWAKRRPVTLQLADRLGRGCGRLRWLDRLHFPAAVPKPDLTGWHDQDLAAVWIGHATVLLRIGNITILTDPVFTNRVGVGLGLVTGGPARLVAPALTIRELPPIDLVLLSHAHYDHLDRPSLARLPKSAEVITAAGTRDLVADLGFRRVSELNWGESARVGAALITACPVRHWGARSFYDNHRGYAGFLIEADGRRVLFGADSGYGEHFKALGNVDLAILGIGGYQPYIEAHASPEQAWTMAGHVRADFILPMHHSTFLLSHEPVDEPMQRLLEAAGRDAERVIIREVGQSWKAA